MILETLMQPDAENIEEPAPAKRPSLGNVLNQSEEIKESVAEAADKLSSVNKTLKQKKRARQPVMKEVLVQNEESEFQVAKAAQDLHQVNAELVKEITEREVIESELADLKVDLAEARADLSLSLSREEEARQIALRDALTGLPNRMWFEQRLDHGLVQAKRYGSKLAVLFIDIDKFKIINDVYGHDLGDQVLLMVANRLQAFIRDEDMVSRWGGDEFVCLLLNVQRETDVLHLARQMVHQIAEANQFGETVLAIKASIGIAIYPDDGETAEMLFKKADQAMYAAKGTEPGVILFRETA